MLYIEIIFWQFRVNLLGVVVFNSVLIIVMRLGDFWIEGVMFLRRINLKLENNFENFFVLLWLVGESFCGTEKEYMRGYEDRRGEMNWV